MERKILWGVFGLLALVLAVAVTKTLVDQKKFKGVEISPAPSAPVLPSLVDQKNQPVNSGEFSNEIVLLFFGYTNCPDVCPLTLGKLKTLFDGLSDQEKENVQVIMVTTDPDRDTPQQLNSYLSNFNPNFLGLTGKTPELEKAWHDYGVTVLDGGETHSARIYVIDKLGKLRLTFPAEMTSDEMLSDVKLLLREQ